MNYQVKLVLIKRFRDDFRVEYRMKFVKICDQINLYDIFRWVKIIISINFLNFEIKIYKNFGKK